MARSDQSQRVGEHLAQTLMRIRRNHLLALMRRGGDPDLAPRREAREFGELAPVGWQRRRVELDVAGDQNLGRAERGEPLAVALAARQAKIEIPDERADEARRPLASD